MRDIKTKELLLKNKGVRTFNRVRTLTERVKKKEDADDNQDNSPEEYAENRMRNAAESTALKTKKSIENNSVRLKEQFKMRSDLRKAVKGTKRATQTVKKTAETTKKTKAAAEGSRRAAEAAYKAAVTVGKAVVAACKAIAEGISELVAAIVAGGWVSVLIIVIICAVAAIGFSCFAVFLPNTETTPAEYTLQSAVSEISGNYDEAIEALKTSGTYDEIRVTGDDPDWHTVLSVFAVKLTLDTNNPQDVVEMNSEKVLALNDVFWKINSVTSYVKQETKKRIVTETDEAGNEVCKTEQYDVSVLVIEKRTMPLSEIVEKFEFSEKQIDLLNELLDMEM